MKQFPDGQLWLFGPKFAQKWVLGSKFQKSKYGFGINIVEILCVPIFRKNRQLWMFGLKFAQKWILGSEFQKPKTGFGISISNVPCVPVFSQNGQLLIFQPKFGEIAQLCAIFWFKYCWGCCRELGGGGWSWVEVKNSVSCSLHIFSAFKAKLVLYQKKTKLLLNINSP